MLVLSRRPGQGIEIGPIVVRVLKLQGGRVKLGIEAPEEFKIHRRDEFPALTPAGADEDAD